jgi:HSP20 family molecular chaperone IbpA
MQKDKRSFFEKLTGVVHIEDDFEPPIRDFRSPFSQPTPAPTAQIGNLQNHDLIPEVSPDAELAVDVYQLPNEIVIKAMAAGVRPEDLELSITRDMVTIRGKREEARGVDESNYFHKELYWGSFSRSIVLPQEVDSENATAIEKFGLLIITLPKLNKDKQTRIKVKSI